MIFICSILLLPLVFTEISSNEVSLLSQFGESNAKFAANLYTTVVENSPNENVIISPFSVQICGSLLYTGAAGVSAEVMANGLNLFQNERTTVANAFQEVLEKHKSEHLHVANKVYLGKDIQVKDEFYKTARNNFFSDEENVDFAKSEETAEIINNWVQNSTHNKIKNLFNKYDFDGMTVMALVNTIYFSDKWSLPFEATMKGPFWISETESKEIDSMYLLDLDLKFAALDELDARAVQLDYNNTDTSMLIILPNERTGLRKLEQKLAELDLIQLQNKMKPAYVSLELPKFHIESFINLQDPFEKMGMGSIFEEEKADFSNMVIDRKVGVNKAVHKAFIDVTEVGTEAGAAAGFSLHYTSIPHDFKVDHPFFFAILSETAVLFTGRFVK